MPAPILYCGDTNLEGAASYLAGLMTHFGWRFDYVPSHVPMTREMIERSHSLLILSDYPAAQFDDELQEIALKQVEAGMGLLMIGGWESFCGSGGNWGDAPLANALPVEIGDADDRINFPQPTVLSTCCLDVSEEESPEDFQVQHHILGGLPWDEAPPTIGGLNSVDIKSSAWPLLDATSFRFWYDEAKVEWCKEIAFTYRGLVVGRHGSGRTAAFTSDVAPHWVGGFVDWGPERVKAQAAGASAIEVGSHYAQFWKQLLSWVGRLE
jgi:uncharacterized membrane protein